MTLLVLGTGTQRKERMRKSEVSKRADQYKMLELLSPIPTVFPLPAFPALFEFVSLPWYDSLRSAHYVPTFAVF